MKLKMILKLKQNIGKSVYIAVVKKLNKVIEKNIHIENVVMKMKSKLNQNIGMSVSIVVVNTVQKWNK